MRKEQKWCAVVWKPGDRACRTSGWGSDLHRRRRASILTQALAEGYTPQVVGAPKYIKERIQQENLDTLERNILYGIEFDFLYTLEYVYAKNHCLYGLNRTIHPPKDKNEKLLPVMCKHIYYCTKKILLPLLIDKLDVFKEAVFINESRSH